ncbi:alpha/beta fold hydrolase [Streptomyces asiaticus]|uniref:alpha/beta fold hydrolase n=1 Tax=Streptomyces asiaticus TaxID=114695 RepID=UPI003F666993
MGGEGVQEQESSWGARDGRTIVLLHGASSWRGDWHRVAPDLADTGTRVTTIDLPGHGGRERCGTSIGELTSATADILAETLSGEPVDVLVGHSLGAVIAMALAARPGLVHRLILEDPPSYDEKTRFFAMMTGRNIDAARTRPGEFAVDLAREQPRWSKEDIEACLTGLVECDRSFVLSLIKNAVYCLPELAKVVTIPVLTLVSSPSSSPLSSKDRQVLERLPNFQLMDFSSGHVIHRDRCEDYVKTLRDWIPAAGFPSR